MKKAREALGDKAPSFGRSYNRDGDSSGGVLGKRRRDNDELTSDEDVSEEVRRIPMPRDTPPPIPKEMLDKWYAKRRARRQAEQAENGQSVEKDKPAVPEPKTVYEAKPLVRNLQKEAVSAFVPTAVKIKMDKGKGQGGLLEPEEADRLEQEGYLKAQTSLEDTETAGPKKVMVEEVEDDDV